MAGEVATHYITAHPLHMTNTQTDPDGTARVRAAGGGPGPTVGTGELAGGRRAHRIQSVSGDYRVNRAMFILPADTDGATGAAEYSLPAAPAPAATRG